MECESERGLRVCQKIIPCHIVRYVRLRVIDNQLGARLSTFIYVYEERERDKSVEMLGVDVEQRCR